MRIAVIGVGGVGGYFGGKLALAMPRVPGLEVYFVARGAHLEAIRRDGLALDTDEGAFTCRPSLATDRIEDLPPVELYLLCVKGYDLDGVLERIAPRVSAGTAILPLLNGIDIVQRIRARIKADAIFPACVYVGTRIDSPGRVVQRGGTCSITLGPDPRGGQIDPGILRLFETAKVKYSYLENPLPELWMKFLFIAAFGLVSAEAGASLGRVMESAELLGRARAVMEEIIALAEASGVTLPADAIGSTLAKVGGFSYKTTTSFYRDFMESGKPDEREILGGTIIALGARLGVPTPATTMVYRSLDEKKPSISRLAPPARPA